jgi:hypothetical protein
MKIQAIQYLALDVHQAAVVATVRDEQGTIRMRATVPTEGNAILGLVRGLGPRVHIAFEEGTQAQHDLLEPHAERVVVCNLRRRSETGTRATESMPTGCPRCCVGSLKSVYHGASGVLTLKELVRCYTNLVDELDASHAADQGVVPRASDPHARNVGLSSAGASEVAGQDRQPRARMRAESLLRPTCCSSCGRTPLRRLLPWSWAAISDGRFLRSLPRPVVEAARLETNRGDTDSLHLIHRRCGSSHGAQHPNLQEARKSCEVLGHPRTRRFECKLRSVFRCSSSANHPLNLDPSFADPVCLVPVYLRGSVTSPSARRIRRCRRRG